jgi:N-acetylmuramoyl-L-alanine amidase-like protein
MCAPIRFTAMALTWDQRGTGDVRATIRVGLDRLHWGRAVETDSMEEGPDDGSRESTGERTGTGLVWVGAAECSRIELTLPAHSEISDLRAVYMNTLGTADGGAPRREPSQGGIEGGGLLRAAPAGAMTQKPAIITRARWGANERYRNCGPYYSSRVKMAFVHHTANSNSYRKSQSPGLVRAIYWYHTKGLGWCDIAYNFLVDKYGQVFEGRYGGMTKPVMPAATKGFNTGSMAVSAIGNYHIARPPSAMIRAMDRVLAWRLDVAHVDPTASVWMLSRGSSGNKYPPGTWVRFRTIAAHRNAGYTSCPGDHLYGRLRSMRPVVYRMGLPKIFDAKQSPSHFITGQGSVNWVARASATMKWRLEVLDVDDRVVIGWSRRGPTFALEWNGHTRDGAPVLPGIFRVILKAWNSSGLARSAAFTLTIDPLPCPSPTPTSTPSPTPSGSPPPSPSPCPTESPSPSPTGSP